MKCDKVHLKQTTHWLNTALFFLSALFMHAVLPQCRSQGKTEEQLTAEKN